MGVFTKLKGLFGSGKKGKVPKTDLNKRFEILGRIGQGSMSKVFRARDRKLGRTVCLKVLDRIKTARFEDRFKGLQRPTEGAICVSLHHPHVVRTFDHGVSTKGEQFLVMEFIEGMGLNYLIETKSPKLAGQRVKYLTQAADALEYTHHQRYLHRDLCPRNIMVNDEDEVKLIDFGLAIPYLPQFCRPGNRTGTMSYLAPELIRRQVTDHRVDVFALGVTAYEIYVGRLPWEKADSLETALARLNRPAVDPHVANPRLDEKTARFLKKAVERDPRDRFQTAAEFRDMLRSLPG